MAEACERAKIKPPINFHALTGILTASHAVMNGVPLSSWPKTWATPTRAWWKSIYGHLAPSYIADAIREGAQTFGGSRRSNVTGSVVCDEPSRSRAELPP